MSEAKFCKNCLSWLFAYESMGERFGTCDSSVVEGLVMLEKEYDGEVVMHTEQYFGCIHFTPQHENVVTKIDIKPPQ